MPAAQKAELKIRELLASVGDNPAVLLVAFKAVGSHTTAARISKA